MRTGENRLFSRLDAFCEGDFGARAVKFFNGWQYPVVVAVLVLLSHLFALEFVCLTLNVLLASAALLLSQSAKPVITFVCSFLYQISLEHSPGVPTFSNYYFSGWRLVMLFVLGATLVFSVLVFCLKNGIFRDFRIRGTLFIPLMVLSVGFITNGMFSDNWTLGDLVFGVLEGVSFTGLFLFFYYGLKREDGKSLARYFSFISALIAWVLIIELFKAYAIYDFNPPKEKVLLGWGIWNTMGVSLNVLMPVCFLGAYKSKNPFAATGYFVTAVALMVAAWVSQSRNALLFGAIIFAACFVIGCFTGHRRVFFRICTALGVLGVAALAIVFRDRLGEMLSAFFWDNGRYNLWRTAWENFLRAPVFGVGFTHNTKDTFFAVSFLPDMAHNTVFQLLSASGVFGLLTYGFYRIATARLVLCRPTTEKVMLGLGMAAMLLGSLLDNFVFYFALTFHYTVALAIISVISEEEEKENCSDTEK